MTKRVFALFLCLAMILSMVSFTAFAADEITPEFVVKKGDKVVDTVKIADENDNMVKTVSRELMWTVQTPQIFDKELYRVCIENAKDKCIMATDDCMLVEAYGKKVKLVETGKENIKITYKSDLILAESILKSRGEE